jgi:hypothetical protein
VEVGNGECDGSKPVGLAIRSLELALDREVEQIAASVRPLIPVYRPEFEIAVEQLACRIWPSSPRTASGSSE